MYRLELCSRRSSRFNLEINHHQFIATLSCFEMAHLRTKEEFFAAIREFSHAIEVLHEFIAETRWLFLIYRTDEVFPVPVPARHMVRSLLFASVFMAGLGLFLSMFVDKKGFNLQVLLLLFLLVVVNAGL